MPTEAVQKGTASDGHGIVLWVPTIANPAAPTVAELTAGTVKKLTYGLTPDGFRQDTTITKITTGRFTLQQALQLDGLVTDTLQVTYVYNREDPTDVETVFGTPGTDGNIVTILGYPNDHTIAAGTVCNAVIPVTTSISRDVPPTANSELAKVQDVNVRGKVEREVAVVAA